MFGVATDGSLHFRQPVVVMASHMDHNWIFHCHSLQQVLLMLPDHIAVSTIHHLELLDLLKGHLSVHWVYIIQVYTIIYYPIKNKIFHPEYKDHVN
jgi:hypothetical protein